MDVNSRIVELAAPAAAEAGLVLESVTVSAAGKRSRVMVTVDLPEDQIGSASMDAVAEASRAISAALDQADVPFESYVLEVGTPGTDRPLTERRHFLRARTRLVVLDLVDGSQAAGRLLDVDGDDAVLDGADGGTRVPLADVKKGRIEVELKRLPGDDQDADDEE